MIVTDLGAIFGLICMSVGTLRHLVLTDWVWDPLYYGLLIFLVCSFILMGREVYDTLREREEAEDEETTIELTGEQIEEMYAALQELKRQEAEEEKEDEDE